MLTDEEFRRPCGVREEPRGEVRLRLRGQSDGGDVVVIAVDRVR